MPSRAGVFRRALLTGAIALSLATPRAGFAEEPAASPVLSWETGEVTIRMYGPHAIGIQYLVSTRDAGVPGQRDRHQQVQTVSLAYNFLGHTRFGAVEWRTEDAGSR